MNVPSVGERRLVMPSDTSLAVVDHEASSVAVAGVVLVAAVTEGDWVGVDVQDEPALLGAANAAV